MGSFNAILAWVKVVGAVAKAGESRVIAILIKENVVNTITKNLNGALDAGRRSV